MLALIVVCSCIVASQALRLSPMGSMRGDMQMVAPGALKKKIVVTGLGVVTPVGVGVEETYKNLCDGQSGIRRLPSWADEYPAQLAGVVDFDPKKHGLKGKSINRNGRYTHFAIVAAREALADAKLDPKTVDGDRFGVIVGSGIGGVEWLENSCKGFFEVPGGGYNALRTIDPFLIPALIANTASGVIAIEHGAKGPNYCVTTACATGSHSIGAALKHMRDGEADIMIAGGSEASITPVAFAGFVALTAMASKFNDNPTKASRPFDKDRAGFVMSEGCGVLVLETEEHALARGATIYCELAGYGATCDAHHITAPAPGGVGLQKCMINALKDGNVAPEQVGYLNAHGTSTQLNDKTETEAIKSVFGDHAKDLKISSIKSMIGHSLGAAGGIEAVVCAKIFRDKVVPPTMNCDQPDIEAGCNLDYVPNKSYTFDEAPEAILSDNLGFGGHNAALVFKKYSKSP